MTLVRRGGLALLLSIVSNKAVDLFAESDIPPLKRRDPFSTSRTRLRNNFHRQQQQQQADPRTDQQHEANWQPHQEKQKTRRKKKVPKRKSFDYDPPRTR